MCSSCIFRGASKAMTASPIFSQRLQEQADAPCSRISFKFSTILINPLVLLFLGS